MTYFSSLYPWISARSERSGLHYISVGGMLDGGIMKRSSVGDSSTEVDGYVIRIQSVMTFRKTIPLIVSRQLSRG